MIIREIQVLGTIEKKEVVDEDEAVSMFSGAVKKLKVGSELEVELDNVEVEDEDDDSYFLLASFTKQEEIE